MSRVDSCLVSGPRLLVVRAWLAVTMIGLAVLALVLGTRVGGSGVDRFADRWLYDALELLAAGGCLLRACWVREERSVWTLLGFGVLSFCVGDILFDFVYGGNPPSPSAADGFYLAFYPSCYAALLLLVRSRIGAFNRSVWLDGLIAALASAAVASAVVFELVLENSHGQTAAVVVNLAYPIGDVLLLGLTVFAFAVSGWRPGREWATLGAALIAITVADSLYLVLSATGHYSEGTLLDALWPASLLMLASAAWQRRGREHSLDLHGRFLGAVPIGCGFVALAVLLDDHLNRRLSLLTVGLAVGTIVVVFFRTALSFGENSELLASTKVLSLTDPLTGLGNRRQLMIDLERELGHETPEPSLLVLLDLNGFKNYNDRFGHPSGDALLARLADKLHLAVASYGSAYRLGGDEFCVVAPCARVDIERLVDAVANALSEQGEGFSVTTGFGAVVLPEEASDPSNALRVADERLYAQKADVSGTRDQTYEALMRAVSEREPDLREHLRDVADLAVAVGSRLGLTGRELKDLRMAAELHDVGKLAIPDAILQKPAPLSPEEWEFVRRHTAIGQRILAAAPALQRIGEVVRATHEHWDGGGYPDGLARQEIPLAARIIAVCDAYTAMTSQRPYQTEASPEQALVELRRRAGSQFDADVVMAFCAYMRETPVALRAAIAELESREWDAPGRLAPAAPASAD